MALLIIQRPTRLIYKLLLNKEPEVDRTETFGDLIYTLRDLCKTKHDINN